MDLRLILIPSILFEGVLLYFALLNGFLISIVFCYTIVIPGKAKYFNLIQRPTPIHPPGKVSNSANLKHILPILHSFIHQGN